MPSSAVTDLQRVDRAARWQLYALSAWPPLVILLAAGASPHARVWAVALLVTVSVAHTAACLVLLHQGLGTLATDGPPDGRRLNRRLTWLVTALTPAGIAVAVLAFPTTGGGQFNVQSAVAAITFGAALLGALTPSLSQTWLALAVVLPAALIELVQVAVGAGGRPPWAVYWVLTGLSVAVTYRSTCWVLTVLWELASGRDAQARLAVAEERLRFGRDLHDVLGRNLTLIAVNSELAAELVQRGDGTASQHLQQVQRIAQDSVRELRDVVGGYRSADLDVELAGARSLLQSAGVRVEVVGAGITLPQEIRTAFGWVVREATTNIIRHSEPAAVTIRLEVTADGGASLLIDNDGLDVRRQTASSLQGAGHGLTGLRQRLAGLDGDLVAESLPGGTFRLRARLPLAVAEAAR